MVGGFGFNSGWILYKQFTHFSVTIQLLFKILLYLLMSLCLKLLVFSRKHDETSTFIFTQDVANQLAELNLAWSEIQREFIGKCTILN